MLDNKDKGEHGGFKAVRHIAAINIETTSLQRFLKFAKLYRHLSGPGDSMPIFFICLKAFNWSQTYPSGLYVDEWCMEKSLEQ